MNKIVLKTPEEIAIMKQAGQKLSQVRNALVKKTKPGIKLSQLEAYAQSLIKKHGAKPSFSMVDGYHWATCINLNEGIVHGVPNDTVVKEGDLVSIDVGLFLKGFHSDSATSFIASVNPDQYPQKQKLLKAGQLALKKAVSQAKPGNHIGHISQAIQETIESFGFNAARNLTGHGIGKALHQAPSVPGFLTLPISQTPLIKPGLTIAIEAIYMAGGFETITDPQDNWTIITKDRQPAAMFEHSVAVTQAGPVVLTE